MKKQETIDAWRQEQQNEARAEFPTLKITGEIQEIVAIDLSAGKIFDTKRLEKEGPWGVAFARWLLDTRGHRDAFPDCHHGGEYGVGFFGFNLKPFVRVLGVECNTADFEVPLGLWYANDMCFDPYDMLVEADRGGRYRDIFPMQKVLARGGLTMKGESYVTGVSPKNDTRVTMELISRFRLVPTLDLAGARNMLTNKAFSTQALETGGDAESDEQETTAPESPGSPKRTAKKKASRKKKPS
jgi:hypothetical protein